MRRALGLGILATSALAALAFACGSGDESLFDGGNGSGDDASAQGDGDPSLGDSGGGNDGAFDPDSACAAVNAAADRIPVYLVFMFDNSDSMNTANKWPPVSQGLRTFFADPSSSGVSASMKFFCGAQCDAGYYQTPLVDMTALPSPAFGSAIDALEDGGQNFCSGTPTAAALEGALREAQTVQNQLTAQNKPGKVFAVLATDGQPTKCGSIGQVETVASSHPFQTYVIGVGGSTGNLNGIADAGGTTSALMVNAADAGQVAHDFEAALDQIRGATANCEFTMPPPPAGLQLDVNKVNVTVTNGAGQTTSLDYDKDCTKNGWHYDNPAAPKEVLLCASACTTVKNDPKAKVNLAFGCQTHGGTPK